ncbi:hypothetical protein MJI37_14745, partial [Salmonella enterica subsp. enterica serovar Cerro]|nr:hypothetical protein [Salmonella enterica subsp. enterica serovar Cerro]
GENMFLHNIKIRSKLFMAFGLFIVLMVVSSALSLFSLDRANTMIMGGGALVNLGFCFIRLAKVQNLSIKADFSLARPLIISNILLSALGGLMWYLQFFFYAWGHARIPAQYDYMSWMLHMSFYVLCGGLVGLVLKEWKNAGRRPVAVLSLGCVVIIIAANIVGLGMAS